jgi:hypothetical protein
MTFVDAPWVSESGDAVVFDPEVMEVDRPYPFRFQGDWYVVVKRRDGGLDTYSVAESEPLPRRLHRWLRPIRLGR